jgi:hypothetical protein
MPACTVGAGGTGDGVPGVGNVSSGKAGCVPGCVEGITTGGGVIEPPLGVAIVGG